MDFSYLKNTQIIHRKNLKYNSLTNHKSEEKTEWLYWSQWSHWSK